MDRSEASAGLACLVNGETLTTDLLHAMKILAMPRSVATTSSNPSSTSTFRGLLPHLRQLAMARNGRNQT